MSKRKKYNRYSRDKLFFLMVLFLVNEFYLQRLLEMELHQYVQNVVQHLDF